MCGIFGFERVHPGSCQDHKLFRDTLHMVAIAMADRGTDSHGWVAVQGQRYDYVRGLGSIERNLGALPTYADRLVAHTRYATRGGIKVENAHPYHVGDLYVAHNGCLANPEDAWWIKDWEVDSQVLAHLIDAKIDPKEISIKGYGTVAWIDTRDHRIRVCRITDSGDLSLTRAIYPGGAEYLLFASTFASVEWPDEVNIRKLPKPEPTKVYRLTRRGPCVLPRRIRLGQYYRPWQYGYITDGGMGPCPDCGRYLYHAIGCSTGTPWEPVEATDTKSTGEWYLCDYCGCWTDLPMVEHHAECELREYWRP